MWLEQRGFIISPHTSAGRVPTNSGYRSFVNSLLIHPNMPHVYARFSDVRTSQDFWNQRGKRFIFNEEPNEQFHIITDTLAFLSEYVGCLAVTWMPSISPTISHRGLAILITQPEFRETTAALPLVQLLESHGDLVVILKEVHSVPGLHIRIGTEHEDSQLFAFSMVASRITLDDHTGVVALFGATRMDYRKAISALGAVINDCERYNAVRHK